MNVEESVSIDLFDHIVHSTNLCALNKNLTVTGNEMLIFLEISLTMQYIRYPKARMYWSIKDGLLSFKHCLNVI